MTGVVLFQGHKKGGSFPGPHVPALFGARTHFGHFKKGLRYFFIVGIKKTTEKVLVPSPQHKDAEHRSECQHDRRDTERGIRRWLAFGSHHSRSFLRGNLCRGP